MNYKSMDFVSFFSMVMGAIAVLGLAAVTWGRGDQLLPRPAWSLPSAGSRSG